MTNIVALSFPQWVGLAASIVLFWGLGYGLLSFFPLRHELSGTGTAALSMGLSIGAWATGLAWLFLFQVSLKPWMVVVLLLVAWLIGLARNRPWRLCGPGRLSLRAVHPSRWLLWGSLLLNVVVQVGALNGLAAGTGSDSYHHTLIAQLIVERGMLPDNYLPYAPIVSFTYHYGFHALVAAIAWLTGLKTVALMPIVGQFLMSAAALSAAFFTEIATHNKWAAAVTALVVNWISIFPASWVNWGRYPQLTGMVLLPLFLGLVWKWLAASGWRWREALLMGVLAAGIAVVHYRVTLIAASGVVVLIGLLSDWRRTSWTWWGRLALHMSIVAGVALILVSPWIGHVVLSLHRGYPFLISGQGTGDFYSLTRLGFLVAFYPLNLVLGLLLVVSAGLGWRRREPLVLVMTVWVVVLLVFSTPYLASWFMDTFSVFISLYFPAAVVVGWGVVTLAPILRARSPRILWGFQVGLAASCVWGAYLLGHLILLPSVFVRADDVKAMAWIQANTPASARFMVNTYTWEWSPAFVTGSDAGYWIPLLANRTTVTLPLSYSIERSETPDANEQLVALHQLKGRLTTPEALALLRQDQVGYVYVGERGGPIAVGDLLTSPDFKLVYSAGQAYVFELIGR